MALRIRVNISAIGSVIYKTPFRLLIALPIGVHKWKSVVANGNALPTRLNDAGDLPLERQLTKTDAAQIKLPQIATCPATPFAAGVSTNRKFWFPLRFRN